MSHRQGSFCCLVSTFTFNTFANTSALFECTTFTFYSIAALTKVTDLNTTSTALITVATLISEQHLNTALRDVTSRKRLHPGPRFVPRASRWRSRPGLQHGPRAPPVSADNNNNNNSLPHTSVKRGIT